MKIRTILENTAQEYLNRRIADLRQPTSDEGSALLYQGSILDSQGMPARRVAMALVVTGQPAEAIDIVQRGEDERVAMDQLPADTLDDLAGVISYASGRACVFWLNAGQPAVIAGNALVNAARNYNLSLQREEDGQSWKEANRRLPWSAATTLTLAKGRGDRIVADWLGAAAAAQSDAGESAPAAEQADQA